MYHVDDYLDGFSAMFGDGRVVFPKRNLPLGAVTVDILNLDEAVLTDCNPHPGHCAMRCLRFFPAIIM